jgi:hypothetical protein
MTSKNAVITAIARGLAGLLWAAMTDQLLQCTRGPEPREAAA